MDEDLETMTREQLIVEAKKLRAGIRRANGDNGGDGVNFRNRTVRNTLSGMTHER